VPTLAWPFQLVGGRLATVEKDSIEDVRQSVHSYLATMRGERPLSPDFGLEDPTFGPGVNTARLAAEIMDSEDGRALVTIEAVQPDGHGRATVDVHVELAE
jgi:hypothetical protein